MDPVSITRGSSPLVLAMPHTGTWLPPEVFYSLNETGQALADTDWHIDRLYDGLVPDATIIKANFHRYLIDANRDPSGQSLYPGQNTTSLCPITDFDGRPIYLEGREPDGQDIQTRTKDFHAPYHAVIAAELQLVKQAHGVAVLYDCHSIRSKIPFLFDGTLPDLNIGTNDGVSCGRSFREIAWEFASSAPFRAVLDGRFKGGWTTRHYGQPENGIHAIQMELAQSAYLVSEEAPWAYSDAKAKRLRCWLKDILNVLQETAQESKQ